MKENKENAETKKEWSQPECYDLDVDKTAGKGNQTVNEPNTYSGPS